VGETDALGAKERSQAADGRVNGIVLDAGGLIAPERNDRRVFSIPRPQAFAVSGSGAAARGSAWRRATVFRGA